MSFKAESPIDDVAAVIQALLDISDGAQPKSDLKKWCKAVLPFALRQLECFVKPEVSVEANSKAVSLGHTALNEKWYGFQEVGNEKKPLFHWEHVLPVSDLKRRLVELQKPRQIKSIKEELMKADIAWILKSEDKTLNERKLRNKRRKDPWDAYRECGIKIVGKSW